MFDLNKIYKIFSLKVEKMMQYIKSQLSSGGGYKANVLSHLSWITWIIIPSSFWGLIQCDDLIIKIFCILVISLLIGYNILKYEYWSKKDPDRLQTEKYVLEKRRMDIFASKGTPPQEINGSEIISSSALLEDKGNEKAKNG
jgi:hypothetical protein